MRKSIVILFILWSFLGYAQSDLYCLHDTLGSFGLATINTTTGVVSNISPPLGVSFYVLGNKQCINTDDSTYTFAGHDGANVRLYTLDLATGTVLNNPIFNGTVVGLRYNCKDSTIYAIEEDSGGLYYLVSVDKVTGTTTQIGIVGGISAYVGDGFALDVKRGVYHLFGLFSSNIHMYSIDINTGLVITSPMFPDNVTGLVYNCNDSTVYGLWEDGLDYKLERIIPSTGNHATVGILNNIDPGFVAESASISENGEYTYRGFSSSISVLVTIDVQTATVVSNVGFTNTVSGIDYYNCCPDNLITSIEETEKKTLLAFPNPFTDKVNLEWNETIKNGSIKIHDVYGNLIFSKDRINGNSYLLQRNNIAKGVYFVGVKAKNQFNWIGKIVAE